jgi:hypothetical protein
MAAAAASFGSQSLQQVPLPGSPAVEQKDHKVPGIDSRLHKGNSSSAITTGASDLFNSHLNLESPQKTYERNLKITSFVLAMIGLLVLSFGFAGWGFAMTRGFGFLYHFAGTHGVMLGLGVFASSIVMLMVSHCRCGRPAELSSDSGS